jgi:prepilin signal peptidase PulO-like enzyme (type II secretory pathway)
MEMQDIAVGLVNSLLVLILLLIAGIDIKSKTINRRLLILMLFGSIIAVYINNQIDWLNAVAAMVLIFVFFSFLYFISRKNLGWGDVQLCTCIAPYLGIERAFTMIFIAMLLCGAMAVVIIAAKKANSNKEVPFAPFVAVGTIVALLL